MTRTPPAPAAHLASTSSSAAPLHDVGTRADVEALMLAFYGSALHDELLGPVFATAGLNLAEHLPRIAAFWEVTLLGTGEYSGRPMQLHRNLVDTAGLAGPHFQRWLVLWDRTLTALFAGPTAERARSEAARIADHMVRDLTPQHSLNLQSDRKSH